MRYGIVWMALVWLGACAADVTTLDEESELAFSDPDAVEAARARTVSALHLEGRTLGPHASAAIDRLAEALAARDDLAAAPPELAPERSTVGSRVVIDVPRSLVSIGLPLEGQRQSWLAVDLRAGDRLAIVGASGTCPDELLGSADERTRCEAGRTRPPLVLRVFDAAGSEWVRATRCTDASAQVCAVVPRSGRAFVTLHQGVGGLGRVEGRLIAASRSVPFEVSGTAPIPLLETPHDVETVLTLDPTGFNDGLGADATELWLLDADLRLVGGDFAQSGIGPAARVADALARGARYAVVRPWSFRGTDPGRSMLGQPVRERIVEGRPLVEGRLGGGRVRVVLNAWRSADADADGLSDEVERDLGTCDGRTATALADGRTCPLSLPATLDPRDTDGDGLTDTFEVLGSDGPAWQAPAEADRALVGSGDTDITAPRWGADPMRRDVFLEVDVLSLDCSVRGGLPAPRPPTASPPHPGSGPGAASPDFLLHAARAFASVEVPNPDGSMGIALHFDIDLGAAELPAHGPVRTFSLPHRAGHPDSAPGSVIMAGARRGACQSDPAARHYGPATEGWMRRVEVIALEEGGGQAAFGGTVLSAANRALAHELGHHLGLDHGGPSASSPHRAPRGDRFSPWKLSQASLMSYTAGPGIEGFVSASELSAEPVPAFDGHVHERSPWRGYGGVGHLVPWTSSYAFPVAFEGWDAVLDANRDGDFDDVIAGPIGAERGVERSMWYPAGLAAWATDRSRAVHGAVCTREACPASIDGLAVAPVGVQTAAGIGVLHRLDGRLHLSTIPRAEGCLFRGDLCAPTGGTVAVTLAGAPIPLRGAGTISATDFAGGAVAVAWNDAGVHGPHPLGSGPLGWGSAPRLAVSAIGAPSRLTELALPYLGAVDGVAVMQQPGDAFVLVARRFDDRSLHAINCELDGCDGTWLPVMVDGLPVVSTVRPALARRDHAEGSAVWLAFGVAGSDAPPLDRLRIARLGAHGAVEWSGEIPDGYVGPESSVSIGFTDQHDADLDDDRLVASLELLTASWGVPTVMNVIASTTPGAGSWSFGSCGSEPCSYSEPVPDHPPTRLLPFQMYGGAIGTFFHADPAVADERLRGRLRFVGPLDRGEATAMTRGQGLLRVFLVGAGEAAGPEYEYEEDGTLAWGLCPSLALSTPGSRLGDDLVRRGEGLRCPALLPTSAFYNRLWPLLHPLICAEAPGSLGCGVPLFDPDECLPCMLDRAIDELIADPWWFAELPEKVLSLDDIEPPAACDAM